MVVVNHVCTVRNLWSPHVAFVHWVCQKLSITRKWTYVAISPKEHNPRPPRRQQRDIQPLWGCFTTRATSYWSMPCWESTVPIYHWKASTETCTMHTEWPLSIQTHKLSKTDSNSNNLILFCKWVVSLGRPYQSECFGWCLRKSSASEGSHQSSLQVHFRAARADQWCFFRNEIIIFWILWSW